MSESPRTHAPGEDSGGGKSMGMDVLPVGMTNLPDLVLSNPALTIALTIAVLALVAWQRTLTYQEYRTAHIVKGLLFRVLDPWARRHGRPLVRAKRSDGREFVDVVTTPPRETFGTLRNAGFEPHLVATLKTRTDGTPAHSQLVFFHEDGTQTEAYLFDHTDGTAVYAHHEGSVSDPDHHLNGTQTAGDPYGVVTGPLIAQEP